MVKNEWSDSLKMEIFFWLVKISILWWILGDELGCVFNFLLKKKRTPIRHLKSKKVLFFAEYEEKKTLPEIWVDK